MLAKALYNLQDATVSINWGEEQPRILDGLPLPGSFPDFPSPVFLEHLSGHSSTTALITLHCTLNCLGPSSPN